MHMGMLAAKAERDQLIDALPACWPNHEPKSSADLAGVGALWKWMDANKRDIPSKQWSIDNPGTETFGFWQDGHWAVMLDPAYVQASDDEALARLSERFGLVLSFVVETAGGCAYFKAFDQGRLLRRIDFVDGKMTTQGERLPEENKLSHTVYYADETLALQARFGLQSVYDLPGDWPCRGVAFIDRTDYGALLRDRPEAAAALAQMAAAAHPPALARPWWKFW